ncbi:MAG TPA: Gfo/Idh/MocA family oxidoreductase, partial [Anaeromyxobacter sp.]|nr:Gfo/Idh/MocA family oxidoreductase [Anaeromyxobacter sp.]
MAKRITVGVIGAGRIGKIHSENIRYFIPGARLKTVADLYADKLKDWAAGLGVEKLASDPKAVLDDPEIEAVLVCSSTDTHADLVMAAAEKRKHVFCEKPVDLTVEKVKRALAAVDKAGVKLQVGFNRRFDHNFRRVRELVASGAVGEPHLVRISSRDPAPPPAEYVKVSGGIFLDMTIHDFDMARYLSGSE